MRPLEDGKVAANPPSARKVELTEYSSNDDLFKLLPHDLVNVIYSYLGLRDFLALAVTNRERWHYTQQSPHVFNLLIQHFNQSRERAITNLPTTFQTAPLYVIKHILSKGGFHPALIVEAPGRTFSPGFEIVTALSHSHLDNSFVIGYMNGMIQVFEQLIDEIEKKQLKITNLVSSDARKHSTSMFPEDDYTKGIVTAITHSQNTKMFITGTIDKKCQVWEKDNNNVWHKTVLTLPLAPDNIIISPTGDCFVALCNSSGDYVMWSKYTDSWEEAMRVGGRRYIHKSNHVCFGPDGNELFIGDLIYKRKPVADSQRCSYEWALGGPINTDDGLQAVLSLRNETKVISHSPSGKVIITATVHGSRSIVIWRKHTNGQWLFPLSLRFDACIDIDWRSSSMFPQDERNTQDFRCPEATHPSVSVGVDHIVFSPDELSFLVVKSIEDQSYIFQFHSENNDLNNRGKQKISEWKNKFHATESERSDANFTYIVDEIGQYNGKTNDIVFSHDGRFFVTRTSNCCYVFSRKDNTNENQWEKNRIEIGSEELLSPPENSISVSPDNSYVLLGSSSRSMVRILQRKHGSISGLTLFNDTDSSDVVPVVSAKQTSLTQSQSPSLQSCVLQ